jgi:aspartate racemase
MKRIGILGGMSAESTAHYYHYITRTYTDRFGDYAYPEILIYSVSFQRFADWSDAEAWDKIGTELAWSARVLEDAGADFVMLACNTMHIVQDQIEAQIGIPMLSMMTAVADTIEAAGLRKVGLLGTRFTMESRLYPDVLEPRGIETLTPDRQDRATINRVIYEELTKGQVQPESRAAYIAIIDKLAGQGAQGIILGCTEIPMLIAQNDAALPLFDTTRIHAEAALNFALEDS